MIKNGLAFLCLIAFASNALAHVVFLTGLVPVALGYTWPLHLMSMVMFLTMLFSLFSSTWILGQDLTHKAQANRGELHEYMEKVQSQQKNQSVWQQMFGRTPVWVGVLIVVMFLYAFGSFAVAGFQTPYSIQDRDGELWFYDEYDGWVRRATPADVERDKNLEIHFATSAFAFIGFVPWAYFTYRSGQSRLENITSNG